MRKTYSHFPAAIVFSLCCIILLPSTSLEAQSHVDPPTMHFRQIRDGLSESNVTCIAEDSLGYLWIGTKGGLNRFDGATFKVFEMDSSDPYAIPDNRINDLLLDSDHSLWVATFQSLARYDASQEHFIIYNKDPHLTPDNVNIDALCLYENGESGIWIGTMHGLYRLPEEGYVLTRPTDPIFAQLDSLEIHSLEEVGSELWIGTNRGLYRYDFLAQTLSKLPISPKDAEGKIRDICADSRGHVWVASELAGLFQLTEKSKGEWTLYSYLSESPSRLDDPCIFEVYEDRQNRIWIGTERNGLSLYMPDTDDFQTYQKDVSDQGTLKTNSIWAIFEDVEGRLYLGSNNQGMFVNDPFEIDFHHIDQRYGLRLKFSTVSSFLEDGDRMWIGTDGGGISIWDRKADTYEFLLHDPADASTLGSNEVLSLFRDSKGTIWTGNWRGGLNRFDPTTGSFHTYVSDASPHSIGSNSVFAIQEDANGDLWMTTWGHGVSRYNRATDDFFSIGYVQYEDSLMGHEMTYDLEIDDLTQDIWVATVLGLDCITMLGRERFRIKHFFHDPEDSLSLSGVNANCILEDGYHRIWVGTNNGLNLFDRATERFTRFFIQDGLPGNVIKDIIQDNQGIFWITTTKGLARMAETDSGFTFKHFTHLDGLQDDEFFINASLKTGSGELFLGGINGFNHFYPETYRPNPYPPYIQLTGLKLPYEEVPVGGKDSPLPQHINTLEHLLLQEHQSSFTISYQGLDRSSPGRQQYAYMLEGFDEAWNHVGDREVAIYTNLDPGEYVFLLKGANRNGVWNSQPRQLRITLLPYWWQTSWAQWLFLTISLVLIGTVVQIRFSVIKAQKKILATQVEAQTKALRDQKNEIEQQAEQLGKLNRQKTKLFSIISHDLRSPINSLKGVLNVLDPDILSAEDLGTLKENISTRIDSISKVMVDLLEWSVTQMEGERSHPTYFDATLIGEEICAMYQSAATDKGVVLVNSLTIPVPVYADPNQVRVILRNLIGNALKFTQKHDMIYLGLDPPTQEHVILKVSDTGIGMTEEQTSTLFRMEYSQSSTGTAGEKGVGLGLLLVKEFIDKNGGKISVESELGVGTTFRIFLPRGCKKSPQPEQI